MAIGRPHPILVPSGLPMPEPMSGPSMRERHMCLLCASQTADRDLARRSHVLHLLALVENPDALPVDAALRLAKEILMMTGPEAVMYRCEAVALPEPADEAGTDRRSS